MSKTVKIEKIICEYDGGFVHGSKHDCVDDDLVVHEKLSYLINPLLNNKDMYCRINKMDNGNFFVFTGKLYDDYDSYDCTEITFPSKYKSYVEQLINALVKS